MLEQLKRVPGLRYLYNRVRLSMGGASQSDEAALIAKLVDSFGLPRRFVEFGFHPREFNCIQILSGAEGLLIDGDPSTVQIARKLLQGRLRIEQRFLTLDNVDFIRAFGAEAPLGVLSIDVDGNDFWFAEALITLAPGLLVLEYNASLGQLPVTTPYDPAFDRRTKHQSGWYHGASLEAMTRLAARNGYRLVATAEAGGNAFFVKSEAHTDTWPTLSCDDAFRESRLRNRWARNTAADQWAAIKDLPYIWVDEEGFPLADSVMPSSA